MKVPYARSDLLFRNFNPCLLATLGVHSKPHNSSIDNQQQQSFVKWVQLNGQSYVRDSWYNVPPRIVNLIGRSLHNQKHHPLQMIKARIADFVFKHHPRRTPVDHSVGNSSLFTLHDQLSPVVTCCQNFDSLLIPLDHPSRLATDTYYVNETTLLRSHTSAHQLELLSAGFDAFMVAGDVYRRDDVDALHYPVFHQMEGVRLFTADELFRDAIDPSGSLKLLEDPSSSSVYSQKTDLFPSYQLPPDRQPKHTLETAKRLEFELKTILQALAKSLFGPNVAMRWVDGYFPFTHPSWELEVKTRVGYADDEGVDEWTELLGCGLVRQELLERAGVINKVGYAFGLGLERWAMHLFRIPDIRLFWSQDSGFLHQFVTDDIRAPVVYKPVSVYPQCTLDLSFWLHPIAQSSRTVGSSSVDEPKVVERDFYDLVRSIAGDLIEQVRLIDTYVDPKTGLTSQCYRIIYRDQHRTLTMDEVRPLHEQIGQKAVDCLGVQLR